MSNYSRGIDFEYEPPCYNDPRGRVALFFERKDESLAYGNCLKNLKEELKASGWKVVVISIDLSLACFSPSDENFEKWFLESVVKLAGESANVFSVFSEFSLVKFSFGFVKVLDSIIVFFPGESSYSSEVKLNESFLSFFSIDVNFLFIVEGGGDVSQIKNKAFEWGVNCFFYEYSQHRLFFERGHEFFLEDMIDWVDCL